MGIKPCLFSYQAFLIREFARPTNLRVIAIKERLKMACVALTVGSLLVLALVLPHADRCLSEALGRDVWDGDAEMAR